MDGIHENMLLSRSSAKIFQEVLRSMREEIDEHRSVLNDNTNDIQTNFEFLCELERKIDQLHDRIDELSLLVRGTSVKKTFKVQPLSIKEKEIFTSVLSLLESFPQVSYPQIAQHIRVPVSVVGSYVSRIQEKGVPFIKKIQSGQVFLALDSEFRQMQITQNVVRLDVPLTNWI